MGRRWGWCGRGARRAPTPAACRPRPAPQVLLNAPNTVGWLRAALLAAAAGAAPAAPLAAWWLAAASLALDAADGFLARRLGQVGGGAGGGLRGGRCDDARPPGTCTRKRLATGAPLGPLQATGFGAALDVLLDNAARAWLWCGALPGGAGAAPALLEGAVFACTHAVGGARGRGWGPLGQSGAAARAAPAGGPQATAHELRPRASPRSPSPTPAGRRPSQASGAAWKSEFFEPAPRWARAVMARGFRSPAGAAAVAGLMGCPLWAWAVRCGARARWRAPRERCMLRACSKPGLPALAHDHTRLAAPTAGTCRAVHGRRRRCGAGC
jgi:hypothetical protein